MINSDRCTQCDCDIDSASDGAPVCFSCHEQNVQIKMALEDLVRKLRAKSNSRVVIGLELSVALNVAERALRVRAIDQ